MARLSNPRDVYPVHLEIDGAAYVAKVWRTDLGRWTLLSIELIETGETSIVCVEADSCLGALAIAEELAREMAKRPAEH